jgi:hypothetical protein
VGLFPGDDRTFSLTLAVRTGDGDLRRSLLDPERFLAASRSIPLAEPWVDPSRAEPTTEVSVMGGLVNRRRRFLDPEGRPRVLGLHAVGDAHTCTNPLYGRGSSLALVQAALLADALHDHPDDPTARALAYEEASRHEVLPWYRASVTQDRENRELAELAAAGGTPPDEGAAETDPTGDEAVDPKAFLRSLMREGLLPAVRTDPVVFRAFLRGFNLLDAPNRIVSDPDVTERVLAVWQRRHELPPVEPGGPERGDLLELLGAGEPGGR